MTFKTTDVVHAIRIANVPQSLKRSNISPQKATSGSAEQAKQSPPKLWDLYRCTGKKFLLPTDRQCGSLWWEISPFEIRFCSKEHLTRNTRYASYPIHPAGQLVRCQSDPFCCTCYCTQVNPLFAFMRGLVALILIHSPSNPPPSTGIHTLASANTRKNELRCVGKFYCLY